MAIFSLELEIQQLRQQAATAARALDQVARSAQTVDTRIRTTDRSLVSAGRAAASAGTGVAGLTRDLRTFDAAAARGAATARGLLGGFLGLRALQGVTGTLAGFERQINIIGQVSNASVPELERLRASALDLSKSPLFAPSQRAAGLEELVRAGFSARQAIATLPDALNLATIEQIDLEKATRIVVNAMQQFSGEALTSTQAADTLTAVSAASTTTITGLAESLKFAGNIAGPLKQKFTDIAAALGTVGNRGLTGGNAGRGLQSFLSSLIDPTDEALAVFERLKISAEDLNPALRPLPQILETLADANLSAADSAKVFDSAGIRLALILTGARDEFEALRKEVDANAGVTKRAANVLSGDLQGAIAGLKGEFERLLLSVGDGGLLGELKKGVTTITEFVRNVADGDEKTRALADAAQVAAKAFAVLIGLRVAGWALETAKGIGSLVTGLGGLLVSLNKLPARIAGGGTGTLLGALRAVPAGLVGVAGLATAAVGAIATGIRSEIEATDETIQRVLDRVARESQTAQSTFTDAVSDALGNTLADIQGVALPFRGETIFTGILGDPSKLQAETREALDGVAALIQERVEFIRSSDPLFADVKKGGANFLTGEFAKSLQADFQKLIQSGGDAGQRIAEEVAKGLSSAAVGRSFEESFVAAIDGALKGAEEAAKEASAEAARIEGERAEALSAIFKDIEGLDRQSRTPKTILPGIDEEGGKLLEEFGRRLVDADADAKTFTQTMGQLREILQRTFAENRAAAEQALSRSITGDTEALRADIALIRQAIDGEVNLDQEREVRQKRTELLTEAEKQFGTVSQALRADIEALVAATRDQSIAEDELTAATKAREDAAEKARRDAEKAKADRESAIEAAKGQIEALRREADLLSLSNEERAKRVRLFQLEEGLTKGGASSAEIESLRQELALNEDLLRVEQERAKQRAGIQEGQEFVGDIRQETELLKLSNEEREKRTELLSLEKQLGESGVTGADRARLLEDLKAAQASRDVVREQQKALEDLRADIKEFSDGIGSAVGSSIVEGLRSGDIDGALKSLQDKILDVLSTKLIEEPITEAISGLLDTGLQSLLTPTSATSNTGTTTGTGSGLAGLFGGNNPTGTPAAGATTGAAGIQSEIAKAASQINAQSIAIQASVVNLTGANVTGGAGGGLGGLGGFGGTGGIQSALGGPSTGGGIDLGSLSTFQGQIPTGQPVTVGAGGTGGGGILDQLLGSLGLGAAGNSTDVIGAVSAQGGGSSILSGLLTPGGPAGGTAVASAAGTTTETAAGGLLGGLGPLLGGLGGVLNLAGGLSSGNNQQTGSGIGSLLGLGLGFLLPGVGTVLGPLPGSLLGGAAGGLFAKGGAFLGGRQIRAFANGGIVNGPTLFPMRDGIGLMGELDSEAVFPITRDAGGRLAVHAVGGGRRGGRSGGDAITVNFNGVRTTDDFRRNRYHAADEFANRVRSRRRQARD